jgi:hypothetical protein
MRIRLLFVSFLLSTLLSTFAAFGLTGPISSVAVAGTSADTRTGFYVLPGDAIVLDATGTVNTLPPGSGNGATPAGNGFPCTASCLLPSAQFGALIGRIGEQGSWFLVGSHKTLTASGAGMLHLAVNDTIHNDNLGGFNANVTVSASPTFNCVPTTTALCLDGSRFLVQVFWSAPPSQGAGQVVPCGTSDSGLLWFFGPNNWELLVKMLDACTFNQRHWVFAAATTNVEFTLRVVDTHTGIVRTYFNPFGRAADALTDVSAFGCS